MVGYHEQIVAALSKVSGLLQAPRDGQCLTFDRCVALLVGRQETRSSQCLAPNFGAAVQSVGGATVVLLQDEVPVPGQDQSEGMSAVACRRFPRLGIGRDDRSFRGLKSVLHCDRPAEFVPVAEEGFERCHCVA